jgi:outer membrane protein assembly factor BamB
VNSIFKIILIFVFFSNCSFHSKSKFWNVEELDKEIVLKTLDINTKEKPLKLEFNPTLNINLYSRAVNKSFLNNNTNNNGRINFDATFTKKSKFKFSKIKNFFKFEPEIIIDNNNVIFFDDKGAILKFSEKSNLIWKKNFYTKAEKKIKPILQLASNNETLIIADNISKYYSLNIKTGELNWSHYNNSPFNSQIKIYKDKFFIIDSENILRCYSLKSGKEIWKQKTNKAFIQSQKKLSIVIADGKVFFSNTLGEISAVEIDNGNLIWQSPTENNMIVDSSFSLKTSDLVLDNNSIFVSNNKNKFFSLDINTGTINWVQKINTHLRSTIINDFIFSVTLNGYLIITDVKNGNIIRATDIFSSMRSKNRKNLITRKLIKNNKFFKPVGFIVGIENIYITTSNGKLLIVDIKTGKTQSVMKIDNSKLSKPFVMNKNLFVATDNSIIRLN